MSEQHGPHEHFEPRPNDMWCDAIDRAYGELAAMVDELRDRVQQLEHAEVPNA